VAERAVLEAMVEEDYDVRYVDMAEVRKSTRMRTVRIDLSAEEFVSFGWTELHAMGEGLERPMEVQGVSMQTTKFLGVFVA